MNYKLLIVDDSKLARMAVRKALNALYPGWTQIEAADAAEAVKAVREKAPDIAVLDFNMPGRDGIDLAAELRASSPGMPVAILSANRQREILDRTKAVGAVFLAKPLTEAAFGKFLKSALRELHKAQS